MKKIIVLILAALLLAGCAPSEQAIATAIAATATEDARLHPSETPTATIRPTSTLRPSATRRPTNTRTPTRPPSPYLDPMAYDTLSGMSEFDFAQTSTNILTGTSQSGGTVITFTGPRTALEQLKLVMNIVEEDEDKSTNILIAFLMLGAGDDGAMAFTWFSTQFQIAALTPSGGNYHAEERFTRTVLEMDYTGAGILTLTLTSAYP